MPLRLTMNLELTDEDLEVIEHVVIDDPTRKPQQRVGEAWVRRVHETCGSQAFTFITAKINKHRETYLAAKAEQGADYKNAAQVEAQRAAEQREREEEAARQAAEQKAQDAARFKQAVADEVTRQMGVADA